MQVISKPFGKALGSVSSIICHYSVCMLCKEVEVCQKLWRSYAKGLLMDSGMEIFLVVLYSSLGCEECGPWVYMLYGWSNVTTNLQVMSTAPSHPAVAGYYLALLYFASIWGVRIQFPTLCQSWGFTYRYNSSQSVAIGKCQLNLKNWAIGRYIHNGN